MDTPGNTLPLKETTPRVVSEESYTFTVTKRVSDPKDVLLITVLKYAMEPALKVVVG